MDYDLTKSGSFMFQDIYLPCDTAQIMRSSERLLPVQIGKNMGVFNEMSIVLILSPMSVSYTHLTLPTKA